MKIVMNCLSSLSGGAVSYLRNLVPALDRRFEASPQGHSLKILAHRSQQPLFPSVADSKCIWISGPRPAGYRRLLWEHRNMARLLREEQADVLFVLCQVGPRVAGVKQVLMLRNMEPFHFRGYRYGLRSWLRNCVLHSCSVRSLLAADRIIAVSRFAGEYLIGQLGIAPALVRLIYHGRDKDYSPEGDADHDRKILEQLGLRDDYLLTCGSLRPYRRCEDVIAAFDRSASVLSPEVKLVIAGSGADSRYGKTIRRAIAGTSCRDRILLVGHVPKETMLVLYRRCLLCIIATEIEACPNIAIEAMSSGCVIISSNRPPLPEIFQGCSVEFRSRDVEDLARQIRACVEQKTLRCDRRSPALKRADSLCWEQCAEQTYAALVDWPEG